ncbi:MAG TPA: hypothetical protein VNE63_23280 [Candidatus Acidoferrales bacterium]|nr:hypothetical protein [Candidatus Acidoferrales bacterium]
MRYVGFLTAILLLAYNAAAQTVEEKPLAFASPYAWSAGLPSMPSASEAGAMAANSPIVAELTPFSPYSPLPSEPAMPQSVQGVFPSSNWQAYIGYTFVRFYVVPGTTVNSNGFDGSLAYYYRGGWFGGEGEFVGAFGSLSGQTSNFLLGAGGPKVRWSGSSGLEIWAHGLVGGAHFSPQTTYGDEQALAYELGAGVDIPGRHQRIAYRLEGDMVGTRFFGSYQYSPKISVGVVYKF